MKLRWLFLMLAVLCGAAYAARKFPLITSASVSAARGNVEVNRDNNGNTRIKLKVAYLAPPANLTPSAAAYVIWLRHRDDNGGFEDLGQLKVAQDRKAEFETVTPAKNFDLIVTAEQDPLVKTPVGPEVLSATIQP